MNHWDILGIAPTEQRRAIKTAYAAKLKRTHPEDRPEAFQQLRRAYETALASLDFLERHGERRATPSEEPPATAGDPFDAAFAHGPVPVETEAPPATHDQMDGLMERVRAICADDELRATESAWKSLLDDEALWSLDLRRMFEETLFGFLAETRPDLSPQVWILLEQEFRWRDMSIALYRLYEESYAVDHVFDRIHQAFREPPIAWPKHREILTVTESGRVSWLEAHLPEIPAPLKQAARFVWYGAIVLFLAWARLTPIGGDADYDSRSSAPPTLEQAARMGHPYSAVELADMYFYGRGVAKDDRQAFRWYRDAANRGNPDAQRMLGHAYVQGWAGVKDPVEGVRWYEQAARQRDGEAMLALGALYYHGEEVVQDDRMAYAWLQKAAALGNVPAQFWMGRLYEEGRGVEASTAAAERWYRYAADRNYALAQFHLGRLYASENLAEEAHFWLTLASEKSDLRAPAEKILDGVRPRLSNEQIQRTDALAAAWTPKTPTP